MPYNVEVKKNVALSRAKIFAALTDFGGVAKILPEAIKSCTLVGSGVGSVRNIVLADGGTVSERLEMAHNQSVFAYSITANTALPVENYFACVTLADGANGSTDVVWASNWTAKGAPESDIKPMLEGLYTALLDGIAKAG
jgi:Polyketide cyclase / dehydrase and lipid transport